ncbi:MAG: hypothetical protein IPM48_14295 [Saprospiraceae bacterium]|nr:hypothetical protein [Saprospiraceae bacterium]
MNDKNLALRWIAVFPLTFLTHVVFIAVSNFLIKYVISINEDGEVSSFKYGLWGYILQPLLLGFATTHVATLITPLRNFVFICICSLVPFIAYSWWFYKIAENVYIDWNYIIILKAILYVGLYLLGMYQTALAFSKKENPVVNSIENTPT